MPDEVRQEALWTPDSPAETLREKFRGRSWLIDVREAQGELVMEMKRWSAVILLETPETWEGMPVRILRQSQGKPGSARRKTRFDQKLEEHSHEQT